MLIIIAGLIGTGKTTLARALSQKLNIPVYSIDEVKKRIYPTYEKYQHHIENNIPFPDKIRKQVFDEVLVVLEKMKKSHKHIIIEETFHKKKLRDPLFKKAKKIFGKIIVIEVKAKEKAVKKRLEKRKSHMVGYGMYLSFKNQWDPLQPDYIFMNEGNFEENVERFVRLLKENLDDSIKVQ